LGIADLSIQANFDEEALLVLTNHDWPRNEEQLTSVVDRLLFACLFRDPSYLVKRSDAESALDFHSLADGIPIMPEQSGPPRAPRSRTWYWGTDIPKGNLRGAVKRLKKEASEEALRMTGGNKKAAAHLLGIDRHTLDTYLRELD
jgi:DNA-binding NtrC family response regulator